MEWFLSRVRGRILATGGEPLRGSVRLNNPSEEQRTAAWRLVGRPRRQGTSLRIDLATVEEVLRRGPWPAGLANAVETLTGPVIDHGARRAAEARAWDDARDLLVPTLTRFGDLSGWWFAWCAGGGLKRAATAESARIGVGSSPAVGNDLVTSLAAVLEELPAGGEPLAVLARRTTGDAHGLDASRPLGRLATTVLREAFANENGPDASARDAWASAGVMVSNVASTVLCLGVEGTAEGASETLPSSAAIATSASLDAMRQARMPLVLTLDQVRSGGVRPVPYDGEYQRGAIYVCENPTVVEVVAQYWADAPVPVSDQRGSQWVLVCTAGQPNTAVVDLLQRLSSAGAPVFYHGDFDWPGLRIAQSVRADVPWRPWRFEAADYLEALDKNVLAVTPLALRGASVPSPWDPRLASVMAERQVAVEEEAVADVLAKDLLDSRRHI